MTTIAVVLRWKYNTSQKNGTLFKIVDTIIIFPCTMLITMLIYGALAYGFYGLAPTHKQLVSQKFVQELNKTETTVKKYVVKDYKIRFDSEILQYLFDNKYFVVKLSKVQETEIFEVK